MAKVGGSTSVPGVYYFKTDPNRPVMALIKHLEDWLLRDAQGNAQAANLIGDMPIYQIRLRDVPKDFQVLIDQIKASDIPIDTTPGNQHGAEQNGSMRDVHQNNDKGAVYLPKLPYDARSLTGKAKAYHDYIVANNKHVVQGKQRKKMEQTVGASAKPKKPVHPKAGGGGDNGTGGEGTTGFLTGYIEYTVTVPGCTNIRLIYDYVTPRFYISPNHYKPWCRDAAKMGQTVKKPTLLEEERLSPQGYGLSSFDKGDMYGPHLLVLD